jgi:hypothetical protein
MSVSQRGGGRGRRPVLTSAVGAQVLGRGIEMRRGTSVHLSFCAPRRTSSGYFTSLRSTLGKLTINFDVTHQLFVVSGDLIKVALAIGGENDIRALSDVSRPRPRLARAFEPYTRPSLATAAPSLS